MTVIKIFEKPKLKNPVLIEGLPGVGNIGRVAVGYMVTELKAKKFAELYSHHFFPFVVIEDNYKVRLLKNEFYYVKAGKTSKRDLILMTGDSQSMSPHGHYEIMEEVLAMMKKLGVKEMFTLGGLATGEVEEKPKVYGAVTHEKLAAKYKKSGIKFSAGEKVGYIVGAAGLLLGLGKEKGMEGVCILGETTGFPIVTDPKAADVVLDTLTKILNIKLDMTKLEERVKEMEKFIHKVEALQRKAAMEMLKEKKAPVKEKEQLRYIG